MITDCVPLCYGKTYVPGTDEGEANGLVFATECRHRVMRAGKVDR